jgi:hypothetical protein
MMAANIWRAQLWNAQKIETSIRNGDAHNGTAPSRRWNRPERVNAGFINPAIRFSFKQGRAVKAG